MKRKEPKWVSWPVILAFLLGSLFFYVTHPPGVIPCDTDTECMEANGGDGGPE